MGKARLVILNIDDIARLFKDYSGLTGFPADAQTDTLFMNPAAKAMRLRITSPSIPAGEPVENIRFDLQRTFLAG